MKTKLRSHTLFVIACLIIFFIGIAPIQLPTSLYDSYTTFLHTFFSTDIFADIPENITFWYHNIQGNITQLNNSNDNISFYYQQSIQPNQWIDQHILSISQKDAGTRTGQRLRFKDSIVRRIDENIAAKSGEINTILNNAANKRILQDIMTGFLTPPNMVEFISILQTPTLLKDFFLSTIIISGENTLITTDKNPYYRVQCLPQTISPQGIISSCIGKLYIDKHWRTTLQLENIQLEDRFEKYDLSVSREVVSITFYTQEKKIHLEREKKYSGVLFTYTQQTKVWSKNNDRLQIGIKQPQETGLRERKSQGNISWFNFHSQGTYTIKQIAPFVIKPPSSYVLMSQLFGDKYGLLYLLK